MARRLHAIGQARYRNNFDVTLHPDLLEQPLRWSQPRKIFVNSMSDLFHPEVPVEFIRRAFDVMGKAKWHTFQILTKRSEGVTVEAGRIQFKEARRSYVFEGNKWTSTAENNANVDVWEKVQ